MEGIDRIYFNVYKNKTKNITMKCKSPPKRFKFWTKVPK